MPVYSDLITFSTFCFLRFALHTVVGFAPPTGFRFVRSTLL